MTGLALGGGSPYREAAALFIQEAMHSGWGALATDGHRPLVSDQEALQIWRETVGPDQAAVVDDVLSDAVFTGSGPIGAMTASVLYKRKVEEYLSGQISLEDLMIQLESMVF